MYNNSDYYPTPPWLVDKMLDGVDLIRISSFLEPSAGDGNIVEGLIRNLQQLYGFRYKDVGSFDIDSIEIDAELRHVLTGKGFRVVSDDYLAFRSYKKYDLIIMNPPFADGDKHLLKALQMQQNGGSIVCLLNAETLKNPYSNSRKALLRKLDSHDAQIEYIQNAFADAERETDVEIALVKVEIPYTKKVSIILDALRKTEAYQHQFKNPDSLISSDPLEAIVAQYNFEIKLGVNLIQEYETLANHMLDTFEDTKYSEGKPIMELKITGKSQVDNPVNRYIKAVRRKYWQALFEQKKFSSMFTTNLREEYMSRISDLAEYDFSLFNIYEMQINVNKNMISSIEDTIVSLFDKLSYQHHYSEFSANVHYYDGWKTNQSWYINKKVIIPLTAYPYWLQKYCPTESGVVNTLGDIEKGLNFLNGNLSDDGTLRTALQKAKDEGITKKIVSKYFLITFYKKGTCHIEFTDLDLLKKFNIFGSQSKGWLPPSYGYVDYEDMNNEEQAVIDSFEGRENYRRTMDRKSYFIQDRTSLLALSS